MAPDDDKRMEKYACDSCRSSKVSCSRECSGCKRCRKMSAKCTYSRSGVIRRNRKSKNKATRASQLNLEASTNRTSSETISGVHCHLAADIEAAREQLRNIDTPEQHSSLDALSSLSESCASMGIRHEVLSVDTASKGFSLFEEYAIEWAEVFENYLRKSVPFLSTPPPGVMDDLRAARPHRVRERAWLVMYYSIILNTVTSAAVKEKLQRNLWLALSDVGVLLEPSEANIQATVLALSQASEFAGPSLCWMLATNACRMLQALGVNQRWLDRQTREQRLMRFWHLNLLDKGLAIIFGRTPTFHQHMVREIGLPTLGQIQLARSHLTSTGTPGIFEMHYTYQKILLSHLLHNIWDCLYGEAKPNDESIQAIIKDLVSWYGQARRILEAAALSEKPFCDSKTAKSIDVALYTIEFHFLYLKILLTRSSAQLQEQCLDSSKQMLHLLQHMAPESKEPYHPIIWQLICCPFTPLLILFCNILSSGKRNSEGNKEALAAMEQLPGYLKEISLRNSFAASLEGIAKIFVQHARSVIDYPDSSIPNTSNLVAQSSTFSLRSLPYDRASQTDIFHSTSLCSNIASAIPTMLQPGTSDFDSQLNNELATFTNMFDYDRLFEFVRPFSPDQQNQLPTNEYNLWN